MESSDTCPVTGTEGAGTPGCASWSPARGSPRPEPTSGASRGDRDCDPIGRPLAPHLYLDSVV